MRIDDLNTLPDDGSRWCSCHMPRKMVAVRDGQDMWVCGHCGERLRERFPTEAEMATWHILDLVFLAWVLSSAALLLGLRTLSDYSAVIIIAAIVVCVFVLCPATVLWWRRADAAEATAEQQWTAELMAAELRASADAGSDAVIPSDFAAQAEGLAEQAVAQQEIDAEANSAGREQRSVGGRRSSMTASGHDPLVAKIEEMLSKRDNEQDRRHLRRECTLFALGLSVSVILFILDRAFV